MRLIKTSILSLIATGIRVLSGLIINKAISIFVGPSGLAIIGQFQNSLSIIQAAAKGGINSGVTKYTAELRGDDKEIKSLWSTALTFTLICSGIISLILAIFSGKISYLIFNNNDYQYVIVILSLSIVLFSVNQLLLSIINGLKEVDTFMSIVIYQGIYSLFFTTLLIFLFSLEGALIALVTNQSVILVFILFKLNKHKHIIKERFSIELSRVYLKKLVRYSAMAIISMLSMPLALIEIRDIISQNISLESAGYWQAMHYISNTYLMLVTMLMGSYYLPRLSEIKSMKEIKKVILHHLSIAVPMLFIALGGVFLMKTIVIKMLFTESFNGMIPLFKWFLIGDFVRICSWFLSYLMLAKALMKMNIFSEMTLALGYYLLSDLFILKYGLVGVTYAFFLNNVIYFFIVLMIFLYIKNNEKVYL
ncbi:O-antigen translocase [Vibrio cyclitrophicus]